MKDLEKIKFVLKVLVFIQNKGETSYFDIKNNIDVFDFVSKPTFYRYIDYWIKMGYINKKDVSRKNFNIQSTPHLREYLEKISKIVQIEE